MSSAYPVAETGPVRPEPEADDHPATPRDVAVDVAVVLLWSLAAGVAGALLWWWATPLPQATAAR